MGVGVVADEIDDVGKFRLVYVSPFEDGTARRFDDAEHAGNISVLFNHNIYAIHVFSSFPYAALREMTKAPSASCVKAKSVPARRPLIMA